MLTRLISNLTAFANPRLYREALAAAEQYSKKIGSLGLQYKTLLYQAERAYLLGDIKTTLGKAHQAQQALAKAIAGHYYNKGKFGRAYSALIGVLGVANDLSPADIYMRQYGAYLGLATAYRLATGGSPIRRGDGERDIIGVPFI